MERPALAILICSLAIFLAFSGCAAPPEITLPTAKCYDGTKTGSCSQTQPYFCKANGQLAEDPEKCGCPAGYRLYGSSCAPVQNCVDGTEWDKCSADKPFVCVGGELIALATKCGCPEGLDAVGDNCERVERCAEGTPYGSCAAAKPGFCANGTIQNKSSLCGCPAGQVRAAWYGLNPESCISPETVSLQFSGYDDVVTTPEESRAAIDYANQLRAKNKKQPIRFDMRAYYIAFARALDMYSKGYIEHTSPTGACPSNMKADFGLADNEYVAENAAGYGFQDRTEKILGRDVESNETRIFPYMAFIPQEANMPKVMADWMNSPGHKANLLFDTHYAGAYACVGTACIFLGENHDRYGAGCYYAPPEKNASRIPETPYG